MQAKMFDPIATYRVQFHKYFNFDSFKATIPYLRQLGIKTIYASPVFVAVPGSSHGYDVTDSHLINPEIGTLDQLLYISELLKTAGICWLQDIVPNHMAVHTSNKWLMDVLAKGRSSAYAHYFDIDWEHPLFEGKIILPLLGKNLKHTIEAKEIKLVCDGENISLRYFDDLLPLKKETIEQILGMAGGGTSVAIDDRINKINNGSKLLHDIITEQHFELSHWQRTDQEINYRRFFTINGLISLNIQHEDVFKDYHTFIKELCDKGVFQGLRVDHVDGLADPAQYLYRLREQVGPECYIVVEKILKHGEKLPDTWPVAGNTGYDFLAVVNNLLTNDGYAKKLSDFYRHITGEQHKVSQMLHDKKAMILHDFMRGELDNLYRLFANSKLASPAEMASLRDGTLKKAIAQLLIQCPVYRYYGNNFPLTGSEALAIKEILANVKKDKNLEPAAALLEQVLVVKPGEGDASYNARVLQFYQRYMQFTGPLMAKGMEDTLMYIYNSLISHNEVGDTPEPAGCNTKDFHEIMAQRQQQWPLTMNATATHDTKRGEDTRARLNALSDRPILWQDNVKQWMKWNAPYKTANAPDLNEEYFIYQALVGAYPMPGEDYEDFTERFQAYIEKAFREAKVHTGWAQPNDAYERAVADFIDQLLMPDRPFYNSLRELVATIADAGIINALSQVVLRLTCPGIPDTYQGTELWDLSMVDPDNRRPVNYELRAKWLAEMIDKPAIELTKELWENRYSGKIKLWILHRLLAVRAKYPGVFSTGVYTPVAVHGKYKDNILAYTRRQEHITYLIVVPLNIACITAHTDTALTEIDWKDTAIELPNETPLQYENMLTSQTGNTGKQLQIADIFGLLPMAIIKLERKNSLRGAGVLLPVFSLPSPFGIGDFGPGAYAFVDFLASAGQKYWQILPLNPTVAQSGHSPYSSVSAMAANTLLLSPDLLAKDGLLDENILDEYKIVGNDNSINYYEAVASKQQVCDTAYNRYLQGGFMHLTYSFSNFCHREAHWLQDFALFTVLKEEMNNLPWYKWPTNYRDRDETTIQNFAGQNTAAIDKVKWLQFITAYQLQQLKNYCASREVQLVGDLPFYVSYDSVDVWSNPALFCLDAYGQMAGIAGVPPDYFSADGQLWNMPTFRWDELKKDKYEWWIKRLEKNLELFDLIRLDHFRAFEAYWEVPAGAENARTGRWISGPGMDFFDTVNLRFGKLPFIAEDLGDNMEDVYRLREKTGLPGMKVLQFAWGENMASSVDIPHNHQANAVVYTGTHDNNTVLGWYNNETHQADRERMEHYLGIKIDENNICEVLVRVASASAARIAILPVQDVLGLNETARMNTPGTEKNNWLWRMSAGALTNKTAAYLLQLVETYGR